jgi:hypothetical protein
MLSFIFIVFYYILPWMYVEVMKSSTDSTFFAIRAGVCLVVSCFQAAEATVVF